MEPDKIEDKFNIMILGDINVGKTTILESYFNKSKILQTDELMINKKPTLGNNFVFL